MVLIWICHNITIHDNNKKHYDGGDDNDFVVVDNDNDDCTVSSYLVQEYIKIKEHLTRLWGQSEHKFVLFCTLALSAKCSIWKESSDDQTQSE